MDPIRDLEIIAHELRLKDLQVLLLFDLFDFFFFFFFC